MAVSGQTTEIDIEVVDTDPDEQAESITSRLANIASAGSPSDMAVTANEHAEEVASRRFNNVLVQGIMTVLIGGILLTLAGVIISDFVDIMPEEDAFIEAETITDPLGTALGLAAIALVVPIVAGVVSLLMGSFGGFMGGGGGGMRRRR